MFIRGVDAWAKENGIEVMYQGPTEIDVAAQVQIMTDLVAQNTRYPLLLPARPGALAKISAKKPATKGIIVIATEAWA